MTYIFKNEGCSDVEINISADNESLAREELQRKLELNSHWLRIDSPYEWEVYTRY